MKTTEELNMTDTNTLPTCWACDGTGTDFGDTCNVCKGAGVANPFKGRMGAVAGVSIDSHFGEGSGSGSGGQATKIGNTVSFARLPDGTWGVRGPANVIVEGAEVEVAKRDGSVQLKIVGQIVEASNQYGDTVARCADKPGSGPAASDAQLGFLRKLGATEEQLNGITKGAASDLITQLKANPPAKVAAANADPAEGFYSVDGIVFKVQVGQSGKAYAKQAIVDEHGLSWDYVGRSPFAELNEDTRLTREQAAHLGQLTGTCCICSRKLTDEESIAAGIGPVCAGKMGW